MSVVFLCVGAAKAGTSWLHAQLAHHPECHFRAIKELHYFNAVETGRLKAELVKHRDRQTALLERLAREGRAPDAAQAARIADRGDWLDVLDQGGDAAAYLAYLADGRGAARVVGEMTPAYALLPETRLAGMARMAPDVRFLYLMRDPVERLWSHVRMIAARRDPEGRAGAGRCARLLERVYSGEESQIVARSDYAGAAARLRAAVAPARLMFEVFEEVVAGEGFARICAFLGIRASRPDPVPVHAGPRLEMTDSQRRAAARWLAPQDAAAREALGRSPAAWARGGL